MSAVRGISVGGLVAGRPGGTFGGVLRRAAALTFAVAILAMPAVASPQDGPPAPVAQGPPQTGGWLPEPPAIRRAIDVVSRTVGTGDRSKSGFYPDLSNTVTGAGWISAGPGYRHWFSGDRAFVEGSAAISWRLFKVARAQAEFTKLARSRLALGTELRWQDLTQLTYFGTGDDSLVTDRSEYRLRSMNVVAYAVMRPARRVSIAQSWGWLSRPSLLAPAGAFLRGTRETQTVFAGNEMFAATEQPRYVHGETSVTFDTRDVRSHPTNGGAYRAAWMCYSDRDNGQFSFSRSEFEAARFVRIAGPKWVMAFHGFAAISETGEGRTIPFYLMPALGGSTSLRGYADYRFHDRHLLLANVESRWALLAHVDAAVFVDAGRVADRVSDLDFGRTSYGIGLRMHSGRATFGRFDVAHSREGWRFLFRISDPLHLTRLSRRTAALPFVF